jgi:XTP/dITP diphosphohydrolase
MQTLPAKILLATTNQGKVREIQDLVRDLPVQFLSLSDVGPVPDVLENGATFDENAEKKARSIADSTGIVTLADDSGLCIDALNGRPGVKSARYAAEAASDAEKYSRILEEMRNVPDNLRTARFVCVLALAFPRAETILFKGTCEGRITHEPRGSYGFGYDPIFFFEEAGCTFAQMDRQSKNRVSHRGGALREFAAHLQRLAQLQTS